MRNMLRKMITHKRYLHSLGVEKTARELAERYGVDVERTTLAGLLHDCGKDLREEVKSELQPMLEKYRQEQDDSLYHAYLGAEIAKEIFQVSDPEILSAIRKHTLGGADMTDMEKIIYLADFFEPGRRFPGMTTIKEAAMMSLDQGLLEAARQTIRYLLEKGVPIEPTVVEMYNKVLNDLESEE